MPLEGDVSLYQSIYLMGTCNTLCGWPYVLLGTLMTCIQPVVYQHHVVFSAKLSFYHVVLQPTLVLFWHRYESLHLPVLNCLGHLPVEVTLADSPSLQGVSCLFAPSDLALSVCFPRAHSIVFSRLFMKMLNDIDSSVGPEKCCS